MWIKKLNILAYPGSPCWQESTVAISLLNSEIQLLNHVYISFRIYGYIMRTCQLSIIQSSGSPCWQESTVAISLLNSTITRIYHIDIIILVYVQPSGLPELAFIFTSSSSFNQKVTLAIKLLNVIVIGICYKYVVQRIHCNTFRSTKLTVSSTHWTPFR